MKKLIFVPLGVLATSMAFGQFFPEDSLIVSRVNGTTSAAQSVDLVGFNFDGTSNSKVFNLSTTGTNFTVSGSATSEGQMNGSGFGYLALGGYSEAVGTLAVKGTTTARRVAVFQNMGNGGLGSVSFVDLAANIYAGDNIRAAYTDDGSTVYTAGVASTTSNGGYRSTVGGVSSQLGTTLNVRSIKVSNGVTYGSTGSATGNAGAGIYSLNGGVETLVQGTAGTGTGSVSPYDFEFYNESSNNYIFISDDRSTANGGGLQVWKGGSLVRTFAMPSTAAASLRSLTVRQWVNSNGIEQTSIFGIANGTHIVGLTFDRGTLEGTANTFADLQTAGTGTVFRSIEAVPEPASFAILGLGLMGLVVRRKRMQA